MGGRVQRGKATDQRPPSPVGQVDDHGRAQHRQDPCLPKQGADPGHAEQQHCPDQHRRSQVAQIDREQERESGARRERIGHRGQEHDRTEHALDARWSGHQDEDRPRQRDSQHDRPHEGEPVLQPRHEQMSPARPIKQVVVDREARRDSG